jgi:hypothetical protein
MMEKSQAKCAHPVPETKPEKPHKTMMSTAREQLMKRTGPFTFLPGKTESDSQNGSTLDTECHSDTSTCSETEKVVKNRHDTERTSRHARRKSPVLEVSPRVQYVEHGKLTQEQKSGSGVKFKSKTKVHADLETNSTYQPKIVTNDKGRLIDVSTRQSHQEGEQRKLEQRVTALEDVIAMQLELRKLEHRVKEIGHDIYMVDLEEKQIEHSPSW